MIRNGLSWITEIKSLEILIGKNLPSIIKLNSFLPNLEDFESWKNKSEVSTPNFLAACMSAYRSAWLFFNSLFALRYSFKISCSVTSFLAANLLKSPVISDLALAYSEPLE